MSYPYRLLEDYYTLKRPVDCRRQSNVEGQKAG